MSHNQLWISTLMNCENDFELLNNLSDLFLHVSPSIRVRFTAKFTIGSFSRDRFVPPSIPSFVAQILY